MAHQLIEDAVVTCQSVDSTLDVTHKLYDKNFGIVLLVDNTNTLEDTPFLEITKLLQKHHLIRVPVVKGKKLIGILARRDVILGCIKATDAAGGGPEWRFQEI